MTTTTNTTTAPEIEVTVVGPNGVQQLEVHAAGCADLNQRKYRRSEKHTEGTRSLRDLVESWYADMLAEDEDATWADYTGEFKVFPCVHLDDDHTVAAKPKRTRKAPATAAKSTVARAARSKVGEYPATPAKLVWTTEEDGVRAATGERHTYRVSQGDAGAWFAAQRLTKGGHWVHIAGAARTRQQAEKLAGWVEAGATWLSYQKLMGVPFEQLPKAA